MKRSIIAVILAGLWVTFFEFLRNELLFKSYWVNHFASIGLVFETLPINGILWMIWSFLMAIIIFKLLEKFSFKDTVLVVWIASFVMMWITAFNLQVLPGELLLVAVPLSLIEVAIAGLIIKKVKGKKVKISK